MESMLLESSTAEVARRLLGCKLVVYHDDITMSGIIVETEAYGPDDPANHAHRGLKKRNAVMFGPPGLSYVYRIYGLYWCINLVTQPEGIGEAVLIRALEPLDGIDRMRELRKTDNIHNLCSGPGKLCMAMGITGEHNSLDFTRSTVQILQHTDYLDSEIVATERIGISQAKEFPWRFYVGGSKFISKK